MMTLAAYIRDVEPATKLADRVGCHHTTIYRAVAANGDVSPRLARRIELATDGKVTRASLFGLSPSPQDNARQVGTAEGEQESGEVSDGVHRQDITDQPLDVKREDLP